MAGIYIPGMEMPINDKMEPTEVCVYPNGYAIIFKERGKLQQYAKVIPVPDHGRLIDADKVKAYMLNGHYKYRMVVSWQDILEAPTIIPADKEVEHEP